MCGIVSVVRFGTDTIREPAAHRMVNIIKHRGPDGSGHECYDNVELAHVRLSIIDLSAAGHQPMETSDGRFSITYNGELYNYLDIKQDLIAKGVRFTSTTDTEVVLHAVAQWGLEKAISRFNGMFAFVIYDRKTRELLVGRDRFGVKPLYIAKTKSAILVASEIKAFNGYPDFEMQMDKEGLFEYFTFQNFISNKTLFRDVTLFPAGHFAIVDALHDKEVKPQQYWDYSFQEPANPKPMADYVPELRALFEQAVKRQMMSDVGVSCYLSGGMDSASITAVASSHVSNLRSFTCGFDLSSASGAELNFDERQMAERMSYLFGTEQYEIVLKSADMERCLPELSYHLDEPRVGQSYPNYYVAGLASKFDKVVMGGTGGDELFGGYPWRYYNAAGARNLDEFTDSYFNFWQRMLTNKDMSNVFAPVWEDVKHLDMRDLFQGVLKQHPVDFGHLSGSLNLALYFEAKVFLHGLLVVDDKLSMAHSMESRVPFLDNDLVDFAMNIPASYKVRDLENASKISAQAFKSGKQETVQFKKTNDGKIILREMMAQLLPTEIVEAQKQGFSAPDASWFRGDSKDFVRDKLQGQDNPLFEFMDYDNIQSLLGEHFNGQENRRLLIWSLLNVNELVEKYSMRENAPT